VYQKELAAYLHSWRRRLSAATTVAWQEKTCSNPGGNAPALRLLDRIGLEDVPELEA